MGERMRLCKLGFGCPYLNEATRESGFVCTYPYSIDVLGAAYSVDLPLVYEDLECKEPCCPATTNDSLLDWLMACVTSPERAEELRDGLRQCFKEGYEKELMERCQDKN